MTEDNQRVLFDLLATPDQDKHLAVFEGGHTPYVWNEAVREIRPDTAEQLAKPSQQQARPGDLTQSCLVVEKARKYLGWSPKTDLRTGIRSTFKWWSEQSG